MAKPRIFVSSTYYDLKHIRANIETFIKSFGYESVLFESGDITFSHDKPLDISCYSEIEKCHMQILIIGGSYGSSDSGSNISEEEKNDPYVKFNSITKLEFEAARKKGIPIYFFVENGVLAEYATYKKNRNNKTIKYAHVSSVNIFILLDEIYSLKEGNFIQGFDGFDDIANWLRSQWAGLMADFLSKQPDHLELLKINNSVQELSSITTSLKAYTEAILNNANPDKFEEVKNQDAIRVHNAIVRRFSKNPLIQYLITTYKPSINDKKLFEEFEKSKTLNDFLARVLSKDDIENFLPVNESVAIRDFKLLKESFKMTNDEAFLDVDESNEKTRKRK